MKFPTKSVATFALLLLFAIGSVAEARIGGGRSSGFRGSRGFGSGTSRSYQTTPNYQQPNYGSPQQQPNYGMPPQAPSSSGAFTRGLLGGMAGGFIGSMLFRNLGHAGTGMGGSGGGIGFFEIMLFAGLGYMLYRMFAARKLAASGAYREVTPYEKLRSVEPGPYAGSTEESHADQLRRYDASFNLSSFKDERVDDFMKLQAAWGQRDLTSVSEMIAPEFRQELEGDISQLKAQGQINRVENIAVRGTDLVEAWAERGKEFASIRFRANVTDYTVAENSGELIVGSKTQSVKFEENWTFVRDIGGASLGAWKLTAIES